MKDYYRSIMKGVISLSDGTLKYGENFFETAPAPLESGDLVKHLCESRPGRITHSGDGVYEVLWADGIKTIEDAHNLRRIDD